MSIESAEELAGMEQAGKVTRTVLDAMKIAMRPGISTRELDELGAVVMRKLGGRSAPKLVYAFLHITNIVCWSRQMAQGS
jgi:methionyl aminopeptidase